MDSAGVLNCFGVLTNEIASLIESNPTNIDFDWNSVFRDSFILKMEAIEQNMIILDKVSGYLNMKNSIFSMFERCDTPVGIDYNVYNWYGYQHNIIVVKLQGIILILIYETRILSLVLYYHFSFIFTLSKSKSYFGMTMVINGYGGTIYTICNMECQNLACTIDKCNLSKELFDARVCNCVFYYTCTIYNVEIDKIKNIKIRKIKSVDYTIGVRVAADDCDFISISIDVYLVIIYARVQLRYEKNTAVA